MSEDVKGNILKYIQNEKDISRYKISTIEKSRDISPAKKRILSIEKEFIGLPIEDIDFEDVADIAAAISIYRTSRNQFYQTYHIRPPELYPVNKSARIKSLASKLDFIKSTACACVSTRVQELNLVQNSDFYYDLAKRQSIKNGTTIDLERRELDSMDLKKLLLIEPITLAKKRARAQAAIFSIGKYLIERSKHIIIKEDETLEGLREIEESLDSIISNLNYNIFEYYNYALDTLPNLLDGTMGENSYLSKLHGLQNILDFENLKEFNVSPEPGLSVLGFNRDKPVIGNLLFGTKKVISISHTKDAERNIQNKVFGILLPIPRKGNEKMSLLHKRIIVDDINVSHLFSDNISNIKAHNGSEKEYFKANLMHPLWKIIEMATADSTSRYMLSKIAMFKKSQFENINFDDKSIITKLNNNHSGFISISEDSQILTAKTRSEEEGISDIFSIVNSKISEIKEDYSLLEDPTNETFTGR